MKNNSKLNDKLILNELHRIQKLMNVEKKIILEFEIPPKLITPIVKETDDIIGKLMKFFKGSDDEILEIGQKIEQERNAAKTSGKKFELSDNLAKEIEKNIDEVGYAKLLKTKEILGEDFLVADSKFLDAIRKLKKEGRLTDAVIEKAKNNYKISLEKYPPLEGATDVKRILADDFEREMKKIVSGEDVKSVDDLLDDLIITDENKISQEVDILKKNTLGEKIKNLQLWIPNARRYELKMWKSYLNRVLRDRGWYDVKLEKLLNGIKDKITKNPKNPDIYIDLENLLAHLNGDLSANQVLKNKFENLIENKFKKLGFNENQRMEIRKFVERDEFLNKLMDTEFDNARKQKLPKLWMRLNSHWEMLVPFTAKKTEELPTSAKRFVTRWWETLKWTNPATESEIIKYVVSTPPLDQAIYGKILSKVFFNGVVLPSVLSLFTAIYPALQARYDQFKVLVDNLEEQQKLCETIVQSQSSVSSKNKISPDFCKTIKEKLDTLKKELEELPKNYFESWRQQFKQNQIFNLNNKPYGMDEKDYNIVWGILKNGLFFTYVDELVISIIQGLNWTYDKIVNFDSQTEIDKIKSQLEKSKKNFFSDFDKDCLNAFNQDTRGETDPYKLDDGSETNKLRELLKCQANKEKTKATERIETEVEKIENSKAGCALFLKDKFDKFENDVCYDKDGIMYYWSGNTEGPGGQFIELEQ